MSNLMIKTPILIALGAVLGALSRHYIGYFFQRFEGTFPNGTFFVNLTGCFLVGLIVSLLVGVSSDKVEGFKAFFIVGFLGSYTTFSAYALQSVLLFKENNYLQAMFYWLGSSSLGVTAVILGFWISSCLKKIL